MFVLYTTSWEKVARFLRSASAAKNPISRLMPIRPRYIVHRERNICCYRASSPDPVVGVQKLRRMSGLNRPASLLYPAHCSAGEPSYPQTVYYPLLCCLCATAIARNRESVLLYMMHRLVGGDGTAAQSILDTASTTKGAAFAQLASEARPSQSLREGEGEDIQR